METKLLGLSCPITNPDEIPGFPLVMANSQCHHHLSLFLLAVGLIAGILPASVSGNICVVPASGTNATDDAPAILEAFNECGQGGTVTFSSDTTYYVNSVMNVSGLQDVVVDIQGTLLVGLHPPPPSVPFGLRRKQSGKADEKSSGALIFNTG